MAAEKIQAEHSSLSLHEDARDQTLQILLNIPNDLILLFDLQGNFLLANETFLRFSGLELHQVLGKNVLDILPVPLARARLEVIRRVARTGKPERFEDQGVVGWFDNVVYPIFNAQGQVEKVVVQARDISERKQVEARLQQSLATIQSLLEAPVDYAAVYDVDGRVILCNETLAGRFGRTPAELVDQNIFELMQPGHAATRRAFFRQAIESGRSVRFQDMDLSNVFDHVVNPIQDPDGFIRRVAVVSRDITELHEAEKAKRRSEALLHTVVNHAPVALFAVDRDGRIILLEGQVVNNLDLPGREVIGKNLNTLVEENYPELTDGLAQAFAGQEVVRTFTLKKGSVLETTFLPQIDSGGNVEEIYGLVRDITEQTLAIENLKQSRHQLEVILGGISDSVTVRDQDLRLIYANDAAAQLKGFANARDYMEHGSPGEDFEIIDADGRPISLDDYLRQRTTSIREGAPLEIRYRRAGAMYDHWIQMKTAPIRDDSGTIQMTVFISRDITEQKRTLEELSRSRNELHQRVNERTSELAAANQVLRNEVELRRRAEDELRFAITRAEALARIAADLNARHDLREIVQVVCHEALSVSSYQTACVFLYEDEADHLYMAAAQGKEAQQLLQSGPAPRVWYEGLNANYGQTLTLYDARMYEHHPDLRRWIGENTHALVVISMVHAGEFIGALLVSAQDQTLHPSEDDLALLRGIANLGATSVAKGLMFQELDEARYRMQEMSIKMIDIQDGERRRLAMELHDQVGQLLTSLGLGLERIEHQALTTTSDQRADLAKEIAAARRQVREVLQQVREMSMRLRPAMLDEMGLVPALLDHFERFSASSGIRVNFRHSGLYERFPPSIENAVFRMIQESLTNVARYAGVQEADVRLLAEEDLLVAQVCDQGIGFDPDLRLAERISSGLSGMNERITLCGGQLTVESTPGQGACLTAEFPMGRSQRPPH